MMICQCVLELESGIKFQGGCQACHANHIENWADPKNYRLCPYTKALNSRKLVMIHQCIIELDSRIEIKDGHHSGHS
jgi:hypothetical protein